ncbi:MULTISPECIES: c-type cytochrome [Methyloversatilis]|uniref:c-type cytochrome n=1 Tax=Methyloversatilis TaxID=378210 RepID=UPI0026F33350|nr:cytochrome c [Methyloversatilis discipulorum]MBT9515576.1 c-type cytochrome [Methyloversatilis discipulorum]MBV5285692.1 c-type cytochrome [Methyloversatilis discipulorum]
MIRKHLATVVLAALASTAMAQEAPYKVAEGNKVDAKTLMGWKTWRSAACERCHGANQEGMVGPSLIEGLKKYTKEEFVGIVVDGTHADRGMPPHPFLKGEKIDSLYAYLKGRSDGKIAPGKVTPME